MAIRPLFEQRRGAEDKPPAAKRKAKQATKKGGKGTDGGEDAGGAQGEEGGGKADVQDKPVRLEDEPGEGQTGTSNQEHARASSPTPDDCLAASAADVQELEKLEEEDLVYSTGDAPNVVSAGTVGSTLLKKLDASSCYEPFLQTEGPKLVWLRNVLESTSSPSVDMEMCSRTDQSAASRVKKSEALVYKTLGKDLRTLGGVNVLITVLLSSRGEGHLTCKVDGGTDSVSIVISESDLEQSTLMRPDLQPLTPKWADWIITKVRCDSRLSFYIDLTDASGNEKQVCFSGVVNANGKEVAVEMVALTAAASLLISVRDATSNIRDATILLRADDLRRLALAQGKLPADCIDQDIPALFNNHDFLTELATMSNVIQIGLSCSSFASKPDDGWLMNRPSDGMSSDIPSEENVPQNVEILDSPNYIQEIYAEKKATGTVAVLVHAYVENCILSTLRHFQQQEAVQLNVAAFMQQTASLDSETAFNDRVTQNMEVAKMAKLKVRSGLLTVILLLWSSSLLNIQPRKSLLCLSLMT
ncbi:unnamed protein product [Phytophthora fragariaefolia]|uniref:Unnamed protein product n=1 Tax=Phytophthora fragariaefolia TaxID=1490495 RepID=A0A9W6TTL1_9STRA|nr:unnamed protein product [Phytophthora fragariaefolia]